MSDDLNKPEKQTTENDDDFDGIKDYWRSYYEMLRVVKERMESGSPKWEPSIE